MNWKDFFEMGGYGFYVWSAYGLMLLVLILNLYGSLKKDGAIKKKLTSQRVEGKRK
jgi:heme exporter protein D